MTDTAAAREEVMNCEQEIHAIKAALRRIGTTTSPADDAEQNSMEIVLLKVEGLPEGAKPNLTLQLSSPIEEGILDKLNDPLDSNPESPPDGAMVVFRGVELAVATLTVTAKDADIPLGSSTPHEVAPLCSLDPMDIKDKYVSELPLAIVADDSVSALVSVPVDDNTVDSGERTGEAKTETAVPLQPICTVTLRVTYKPSPKDQREELYELLNKTSQRKATALENLRKISMRSASARSAAGGSTTSSAIDKPSVKPGFLNKSKDDEKEQVKESQWMKLYNRTLGPNSLVRQGAFVALAAKDIFIFLGAIAFFHFKGHLLAIPPPV